MQKIIKKRHIVIDVVIDVVENNIIEGRVTLQKVVDHNQLIRYSRRVGKKVQGRKAIVADSKMCSQKNLSTQFKSSCNLIWPMFTR